MASRWLRHHPDASDATRPAGSRGVVPNTVTFTEKRSPCRGRCTRNSFERDGLTNKRRVGRLEAVALEGPQIQLVVELILRVELGHEVLDRRRRLCGAVRRMMRRISRVREVRHGLLEADVVAELQGRPIRFRHENVIES